MEIAPRMKGVKVGSRFFGGQSLNPDLVPFPDSPPARFRCMGGNRTVTRETPSYWVDDIGNWWRKSDGLRVPTSPLRIHLVPIAG